VGEGDDGPSSEGVWLTVVCSTARASGGEVEAFDSGGGVDAEGHGVERCIVLAEVSIVVTRFGEVAGMGRLSVVV